MKLFQIVSDADVDMGIYEGATAADALDAMARDAGYASQAAAAATVGPFEGTVTEVVASVALGGQGVPEADYEAWIAYASSRIGAVLDFPVEVGESDERGAFDVVTGATEEQIRAAHTAIAGLWLDFCAT